MLDTGNGVIKKLRTIRGRLTLSYFMITSLTVFISVLGSYTVRSIDNEHYYASKEVIPALVLLEGIKSEIQSAQDEIREYSMMISSTNFGKFEEQLIFSERSEVELVKRRLESKVNSIKNIDIGKSDKALVAELEYIVNEFGVMVDILFELPRSDRKKIDVERFEQIVTKTNEKISDFLQSRIIETSSKLHAIEQSAYNKSQGLIFQMVLIAVIAVLWSLVLGAYSAKKILVPIKRLHDAVVGFGQGKEDNLEGVRFDEDEIGLLAQSFKNLSNTLSTTQKQLIQSSKLASLGELSSGVAHELNNPLLFIMGFNNRIKAALKKHGTVTEKEIGEFIFEINDGAERMKKIISHFREFSRASDNVFQSDSVNEIIRRSFVLISEQLKINNVAVEFHLSEAISNVLVDRGKMEQVFINIISNSRDALLAVKDDRVKMITVKSRQVEDKCIVVFEDNGSGIRPEDMQKVFDPFYTTKDVGHGTGLGLSISYGIIREHSGEILIDSKPDAGTKVIIVLPIKRDEVR